MCIDIFALVVDSIVPKYDAVHKGFCIQWKIMCFRREYHGFFACRGSSVLSVYIVLPAEDFNTDLMNKWYRIQYNPCIYWGQEKIIAIFKCVYLNEK